MGLFSRSHALTGPTRTKHPRTVRTHIRHLTVLVGAVATKHVAPSKQPVRGPLTSPCTNQNAVFIMYSETLIQLI